MKELIKNAPISRIVIALGFLAAVLFVFWAGTQIGYRRAMYSFRWSDNYSKQFAPPFSPFGFDPGKDAIISSNGAFGSVAAVRLPDIVVKGRGEVEKVVVVNSRTVIRRFHAAATSTDIRVGDTVLVLGEPDQEGRITASLVRIVPAPAGPRAGMPSAPLKNI